MHTKDPIISGTLHALNYQKFFLGFTCEAQFTQQGGGWKRALNEWSFILAERTKLVRIANVWTASFVICIAAPRSYILIMGFSYTASPSRFRDV